MINNKLWLRQGRLHLDNNLFFEEAHSLFRHFRDLTLQRNHAETFDDVFNIQNGFKNLFFKAKIMEIDMNFWTYD